MKKYLFISLLFLSFQDTKEISQYQFSSLYHFPEKPLNKTNTVTNEGVELGRYLFYDKILSKDNSISCASCHKQEYAFADNRQFSLGINNQKLSRNTLPLFNLAWYSTLFWDGRAKSIEEQIFFPVSAHQEMDLDWVSAAKRIRVKPFYVNKFRKVFGKQKIDSVLISKAIAQFERILISNNSKYDKALQKKSLSQKRN